MIMAYLALGYIVMDYRVMQLWINIKRLRRFGFFRLSFLSATGGTHGARIGTNGRAYSNKPTVKGGCTIS